MASPTHEFEQALGDGEGQGGLAYYSHCGGKESDTLTLQELHFAPIFLRLYAQYILYLVFTTPLPL